MNENSNPSEQPDAAFDRLRGVDPAAGAEPDLTALDAVVRARRADVTDELATVRARRGRRTWMTVAAAAAGALVFGSGGFALGTARDHPTSTAGGVITLGQQRSSEQGAGGGGLTAPEAATGAADNKLGSSMLAPWYGGRTVFTASGLSDEAGSADAWTFDPAQVFTEETANRLAQALGVQGPASLVDGVWTVGPNDGSGPSLQLQPDGLASVNYYDTGLDPYACSTVGPQSDVPQSSDGSAATGSGTTGSGTTGSDGSETPAETLDRTDAVPVPEPPVTCPDTTFGPAPQGDAAVAKAKDLIGSLGLDAATFEYETQDSGMPQSSYVTAFQVVGGQRTGLTWSIGLVGDGVQSLYGSLAPVVSLGSYDVVSAKAAVARLTDPRFGASYGYPMLYAAGQDAQLKGVPAIEDPGTTTVSPEIAPAPEPTIPPMAKPGSAIAWPVTEITLTSARLGLTMYTQPDGATLLLPAYELSSADGQAWSVVAVADSDLDFSPIG